MKGRFSPGYAAWLRLPYCSDNGIAISIRRVNPNNPLRNVRMIMPGLVGVKFKASRYVRCTWRDMNLYWINMWCLLQPWQWLAISPLRILRDSWSWAFSSMVSDAFQVDLELRTSTLKGFLCFKSLRKIGDIKNIDINWNSICLSVSMSNESSCCESCEEKSGALLNSSSDGLDSYQFGVWATKENHSDPRMPGWQI